MADDGAVRPKVGGRRWRSERVGGAQAPAEPRREPGGWIRRSIRRRRTGTRADQDGSGGTSRPRRSAAEGGAVAGARRGAREGVGGAARAVCSAADEPRAADALGPAAVKAALDAGALGHVAGPASVCELHVPSLCPLDAKLPWLPAGRSQCQISLGPVRRKPYSSPCRESPRVRALPPVVRSSARPLWWLLYPGGAARFPWPAR